MTQPNRQPHRIEFLLPSDIASACERLGEHKAKLGFVSMIVLGGLAGAFIALGCMLYTIAITDSALGFGPTRVVGGITFALGLILVILAGAELFTGNTLTVMAWASGRVATSLLLRSWVIVFFANFAGALATLFLIWGTGQWDLGDDAVGGRALQLASLKVSYGFGQAIALGVLCNALVALAVWLSLGAESFAGKVLAIVFPVTGFVGAGLEHCVANMYFIPAGLVLEHDAAAVAASGLSPAELDALSIQSFLVDNLLPVTIGNIIGGGLLVGLVYWFVYLRHTPDSRFAGIKRLRRSDTGD